MDMDFAHIWSTMSFVGKAVVVLLVLMSIWSVYVTIERLLVFRKAKQQSLQFAKQVTQYLAQDRLSDAIEASRKYKHSHLARVTRAGLIEMQLVESKSTGLSSADMVEAARRARITGVVIVETIIDKQGNVDNVRVLKALPMGLDNAAVEAVKKWKFKPATLNGRPVNVYFVLTVNFQLQ